MIVRPQAALIREALDLFLVEQAILEVRALDAGPKRTIAGYFDLAHIDDAVEAAIDIAIHTPAPAIYCTLNPVDPILLARAVNRVEPHAKTLTANENILCRRWVLIDLDVPRPTGISTTDIEHDAALAATADVQRWLEDTVGVPADAIVRADSGNGGHLLLHINLPNDAAAEALIKRVLAAVAQFAAERYPMVKVDASVTNAARICKLYGTVARKGDSTAERPHRLAQILSQPDRLTICPPDLLAALAHLAPAGPSSRSSSARHEPPERFDARAFLAGHGVEIRKEKPFATGMLLELAVCPWNPEHARGEAWVFVPDDGPILAGCHHDSCQGKQWADLREAIGAPRSDGRRPAEPRRAETTDGASAPHEPGEPPPAPETGAEPSPASEVPPLGVLLDAIIAVLTRYVVFRSPAQTVAIALWIAHTHALAAFDVTAYLDVRSAARRSGKSRLLEVIRELIPSPELVAQLTEAATFRLIEDQARPPTLLIDEVDAIFKGPPTERTEGLRALLNAGYRRGLTVPRCVGMGRSIKVHRFPTFCPKAFSGIGSSLPDTVTDRSISIVLPRRKQRSEPVVKLRPRTYGPEATKVREMFAMWAGAAVKRLGHAEPEMPDLGNDRAEEVWEPLLAIADDAGGDWPQQARAAALELSGGEPDTESIGVLLLRAIYEVFHPTTAEPAVPNPDAMDRMFTADIIGALIERESEPWGAWWGRDMHQGVQGPATKLASLLKPFGVIPKSIRIDGHTAKGYERAAFADAWERYVAPAAPPSNPSPAPECDGDTGRSRHAGTTVGAQGFETLRHARGEIPAVTPETLGAQGLCRRDGSEAGAPAQNGTGLPGDAAVVLVQDVFPGARVVACLGCGGTGWRSDDGRCAACGAQPELERTA